MRGVGIGLSRSGIPLEGMPGTNNSYAIVTGTGRVYHSNSLIFDGREYTDPIEQTKVVGCCWDIQKSSVYFTVDGRKLPKAFDLSKKGGGTFIPTIWLPSKDTVVRLNFGQNPFVFNFENEFPLDYAKSAAISNAGPRLSEVEIMRATLAEQLQMMFPVFPVQLCVIALERGGDQLDVAAGKSHQILLHIVD